MWINQGELRLLKSGLEPTNVNFQQNFSFENYPNPSANTLNIYLELGHDENTRLSITDIPGNEQLVLKEGFLQSGKYKFNFDISSLPAGIYFIRLRTDNSMITRKLIVGR